MNFDNINFLSYNDEIKFVVNSLKDYRWAKEIISKFSLHKKTNIIISPVWNKIEPSKVAKWILKDNLPVRFQIQLHKIIKIK